VFNPRRLAASAIELAAEHQQAGRRWLNVLTGR